SRGYLCGIAERGTFHGSAWRPVRPVATLYSVTKLLSISSGDKNRIEASAGDVIEELLLHDGMARHLRAEPVGLIQQVTNLSTQLACNRGLKTTSKAVTKSVNAAIAMHC